MEDTKTKQIIDMHQLEWELRTNDYDEREIDAIMERAREINGDTSHVAQKLNELIFQQQRDQE